MKSFKDFIVNESTFDTKMRNLLIQSNGFTKKIFISKLDALDNALKDNKLFDVIGHVLDRIINRNDLFCVLIRNLDIELLLKSHNKFNHIQ